ncbi:MAG TPA: glucose-6-phosphate dehydrogenase assembly protein OpcA [Opitutaceae bacterium]
MAGIFDALPGIEAPVGAISKGLAQMWEGTASAGKPSPPSEHAKAIQVNFVLHLGLRTDAADAVVQFDTAVRFSRRYPSRVVVLCPLAGDAGGDEMRAKVYGECTLGKSAGDTRCCEFVMLSYPRSARAHLESQVSVCLSTDLPIYYWAHRFSEAVKLADYRYLLTSARRVLIDSATEPPETFTYPWPRPENLRDLAFARLLPVRQSIGQFLSRYPMVSIAKGLTGVRLSHGADLAAEARVLLAWVKDRTSACGGSGKSFEIVGTAETGPKGLRLTFAYGDTRSFSWTADLAGGHATFDANFGSGRTVMPATAALLAPENALSEAMFF